jgi:hypothetical protein
MPSATRITATAFQSVLSRLGINKVFPFDLINTVQPVSLVDTDIPLTLTDTICGTPASAGELVAPAANTVLADSGAQAADNYAVYIIISIGVGTVNANASFRIQHRDSANAANIWSQLDSIHEGKTTLRQYRFTKSLAQNERIRVIAQTVGAGCDIQANVFVTAV